MPKQLEQQHFYRVVAFVGANALSDYHNAVARIASIVSIEDWYDEPSSADQNINNEGPHEEAPVVQAFAKHPGKTLVDIVLAQAARANGVTRGTLKALAEKNGFNVGSVSPTLVKLMTAKKLKRTAPGVYAATGK